MVKYNCYLEYRQALAVTSAVLKHTFNLSPPAILYYKIAHSIISHLILITKRDSITPCRTTVLIPAFL